MKRALMILCVALGAMFAATGSTFAASPSSTAFVNPDVVHPDTRGYIAWSATRGDCTSTTQGATAYMESDHVSGIDQMAIFANFARQVNGTWRVTRTYEVYDSPGNSGFFWLRTSHRFAFRGADFTHHTRIQYEFDWYHNGAIWYTHYKNSGYC